MRGRLDGATFDRQTPRIRLEGLRVHMIGIGGCGMSGAAGMLVELGSVVSGSDLQPFEGLGSLVSKGVRVAIGHDQGHLTDDIELVVISAAIPETNPELALARSRGLRVIKYAELLGILMTHRRGIAVAGTHGKSTTTAMAAHIFRECGLDPSFVVGARSAQLGGSSGVGSGPHFIVEACEYDRSFLHLNPRTGAILNIEPDHLDCFGNFEAVVEAFAQFARRVDPAGLVLCNAEDRWARHAADRAGAVVETFGFEKTAHWRAVNLESDRGRFAFEVRYHDTPLLSTHLTIPGRYNVGNALAALALGYHAGAAAARMAKALPAFAGIGRRLTWRGEGSGVQIVDDYAHHPTEIRVTIEAARHRYQPKRVWVVFQPHQYARTRVFLEEFAESFTDADEIIVPDVYGAREEGGQDALVGSEELVSRIVEKGGRARYLATLDAAADHVARHVTEGDLIMTMGAGDVWKVADELVERIC